MHSDTPLMLPVASTTLVFGLEWFPLLGGRLRRHSLRLARKHGASHLVLSGEQAGSVGMGSLRKLRNGRNAPLYSAAQCFAGLFAQGTVALILPLHEHGWWFVAAHEGAVVARTDKLYEAVDLAHAALSALRVAYPQIRDLTEEAGIAPSLNELQANGGAASLLRKARRWHSVFPMPVQLLALALTVAAAAPHAVKGLRSKGVQPQVLAQPDVQMGWQAAIREATRARCLHGLQGTRPVLNSLYELPVAIDGWHLTRVECSSGRSAWTCQAEYQRRNQTASNDGFLRQAPSLWSSRFPTMDLAKVTWPVPASCSLFSSQNLNTAAHNERHLFSAWQSIRPAFSRIEAGQPKNLPVIPPRDSKGQPLNKPHGLAAPLYRELYIQGPLRSFELLLPHIASVEWRTLVLNLNETIKPTLTNSQLNVTFQGVLHENESLPTARNHPEFDATTPAGSPG